ncbi:hypothetical protein Glove_197g112 [Diversispora epigaea]|uniref:DUF659 domain-containing protein n=1 Tax=Diversispora epigaea TaxID=1348612 RepID=A0A397IQF6_9GLOM|nr:hypothetical protein Glove_197g112 [Diversispora epigaea]
MEMIFSVIPEYTIIYVIITVVFIYLQKSLHQIPPQISATADQKIKKLEQAILALNNEIIKCAQRRNGKVKPEVEVCDTQRIRYILFIAILNYLTEHDSNLWSYVNFLTKNCDVILKLLPHLDDKKGLDSLWTKRFLLTAKSLHPELADNIKRKKSSDPSDGVKQSKIGITYAWSIKNFLAPPLRVVDLEHANNKIGSFWKGVIIERLQKHQEKIYVGIQANQGNTSTPELPRKSLVKSSTYSNYGTTMIWNRTRTLRGTRTPRGTKTPKGTRMLRGTREKTTRRTSPPTRTRSPPQPPQQQEQAKTLHHETEDRNRHIREEQEKQRLELGTMRNNKNNRDKEDSKHYQYSNDLYYLHRPSITQPIVHSTPRARGEPVQHIILISEEDKQYDKCLGAESSLQNENSFDLFPSKEISFITDTEEIIGDDLSNFSLSTNNINLVKRKHPESRKTGEIWNYFIKGKDLGKGLYETESRNCKKVSDEIRTFWKEIILEEASNVQIQNRKQPQITKHFDSITSLPTAKTNELDQAILKAWVCCRFPFQTIENPFIINLFRIVIPGYNLPSRLTLFDKLLEQETLRIEKKIENKLEKDNHLTISLDGWTSSRHDSIYNYIITTSTRKEYLIKLKSYNIEKQTGSFMTEEI